METLARFFVYFIIYSVIGWIIEVIWMSFLLKRFANRGYLLGPLCPIYGFASLAMIFIIGPSDTSDILAVFLKSALVCSVLEYVTSFVMEKLFKTRWWDYSENKFNLNGRICLSHIIIFGVLGTLLILFIQPFIVNLVAQLPLEILYITATTILVFYISDSVLSFFVMQKIKNKIKSVDKDNTELIKRYMLEWLGDNSFLYRRLKNAYPNFVINISNLKKVRKK